MSRWCFLVSIYVLNKFAPSVAEQMLLVKRKGRVRQRVELMDLPA